MPQYYHSPAIVWVTAIASSLRCWRVEFALASEVIDIVLMRFYLGLALSPCFVAASRWIEFRDHKPHRGCWVLVSR